MRSATMILAISLLAACSHDEPATDAKATLGAAARASSAEAAAFDPRDQYELLSDLIAARRADREAEPEAHDRVVQSWSGRRYRWELAHLPILCRGAAHCVMGPFDHERFERPIHQGWLPRLDLDEGGWSALDELCAERERCIVTIEGELSELVAGPDQPTRLRFSQVKVLGAREARVDESWVVSRS